MYGMRQWGGSAVCVAVLVLSGCGSSPINHAPVEDRNAAGSKPGVVMDARTQAVKQPPGFENAGKASLELVLKVAHALARLDELDKLFRSPAPRSLAELELRAAKPARRRGRI